jgi:uncharacterized membrane protein YcaP (DUF421 family)
MESILRGAATYLFVWLIFRITGKRTLAQITTFDAVLLLIISETTQAALVDNDNSFTNSALLILSMLGLDVFLSCVKQRFPAIEKAMDGTPVLILNKGELQRAAMERERIDERDILHAARDLQGIGTLAEVEYAILEQTGEITIIPKKSS